MLAVVCLPGFHKLSQTSPRTSSSIDNAGRQVRPAFFCGDNLEIAGALQIVES